MRFTLEQIDRAIEWAIRDEVIAKGYWPNQRGFLISGDEAGYTTALDNLSVRIDVFGVGGYKDREQLKKNNIIIDRADGIGDGMMSFSLTDIVRNPNGTYKKVDVGQGSNNIEYEIRFVADDVFLDRVINTILLNAFNRRKEIFGVNSDLSLTTHSFFIERNGPAVDLSDKDYIERVYKYIVRDVFIGDEKIVEDNIPAVTQIKLFNNTSQEKPFDVAYPESRNDVTENDISVVDYFLGVMEDCSAWNNMLSARLYTQATEVVALKDLINKSITPVNTGLTFTAYRGFTKTAVGQFINTKTKPNNLTSFSYSVFVTSIPESGTVELFGLSDLVKTVSFSLMRTTGPDTISAKANSDNLLSVLRAFKSNTLYVLNARNRLQLELFEGSKLIGYINLSPTDIPDGEISDLNILNQLGVAIGSGTGGGIAFSSLGKGLSGSEIREFNDRMRFFMTQVGLIV
jgi:hypothetical protein